MINKRSKNGIKKEIQLIYDNSSDTYDSQTSKSMRWGANQIISNIQVPENPLVLDIGCGTGIATFELLRKFKKGLFYGVDISPLMIQKAEAKASIFNYKNVKFSVGDAENLEFPDSMFNLIISNIAFHWFPNKNNALSEMYRVLKPGCQLLMTFCGDNHFTEIKEIFYNIASSHNEEKVLVDLVKYLKNMHPKINETKIMLLNNNFEVINITPFYGTIYIDLEPNLGINRILDNFKKVFSKRKVISSFWTHGIGKIIFSTYKKTHISDLLESKTMNELKLQLSEKGIKISTCLFFCIAEKVN